MTPAASVFLFVSIGGSLLLWTLLRLASRCESKAEREAADHDKEVQP